MMKAWSTISHWYWTSRDAKTFDKVAGLLVSVRPPHSAAFASSHRLERRLALEVSRHAFRSSLWRVGLGVWLPGPRLHLLRTLPLFAGCAPFLFSGLGLAFGFAAFLAAALAARFARAASFFSSSSWAARSRAWHSGTRPSCWPL